MCSYDLLVAAAVENLTADAFADRWIAVLEAAAFSPVRQLVAPAAKPTQVTDDLMATVRRLAPALPKVAALFDVTVDAKAAQPKPLRPTKPSRPAPKGVATRAAAPAPAAAPVQAPAATAETAPAVEAPDTVEAPVTAEETATAEGTATAADA